MKKPNILFIFADQWRAQAFGYTGNPDVQTPNIDQFAHESANLSQAISPCPLCSPYRASLITGQLPLTHGVFINDVPIKLSSPGIGNIFKNIGYDTAYIGKWHINGQGRESVIPESRRFGFDYWKVLECSHNYCNSPYYDHNHTSLSYWEGYDAYAQTDDAISYMAKQKKHNSNPFCLFLSWGPPHAPPPYMRDSPYDQYPEDVAGLYQAEDLEISENVPASCRLQSSNMLEGYYAHCTALDNSFGKIRAFLKKSGLDENTILIFTSDHGDMLGSHGLWKKQVPFEESILVPFLIQTPAYLGVEPGVYPDAMIEPQDILPTLLGLLSADIPNILEGTDYSGYLKKEETLEEDCALISVYQTGGQWTRDSDGGELGYTGREYRGIRTNQFLYVIDKQGPWLCYDLEKDPKQLHNLVGKAEAFEIMHQLQIRLNTLLQERNDQFKSGFELLEDYGYTRKFATALNPNELELYLSNWGYETEGKHHE